MIFISFVVLSLPVYAVEEGDVVFNELMWMGDFGGNSHEWIELRNTTDVDIDLTGWDITKLSDEGETLKLTIPAGVIPARGYFLISNNNAEDSNIAVEPDIVDSSVSLANSKLQLKLYDGPWDSGGVLIDAADDGTGAPAAGDSQLMKSMVRNDPPGDGMLAENWHTADTQAGWDDGANELGTPQNSTWGVEVPPYEVPVVVFSELMWMGDFAAASHEWIELQNTTDQDIDLSSWQITRLGDKEETAMLTIPSGVIPAYGYFLIANNKAEEANFAVEPDLVTADVTLPNNQLQLKLYDGPFDGEANLIDIADDGTGAPAAGDADTKKSMVRNIPIGDGILTESWHIAEEQSGWDADAQEFGTPQSSKPPVKPTPYKIPAVIFSELMWMGDFAAASHEWIELHNTTDQEIDLSGWQVTRLVDSEETAMLTIPSGIIPAHSYFLIANNKAEEANFTVGPDLVTADVTLPNNQLQLKLYDGPFDGGANLIDIVDDGMGAPAAGDADAKKAMVRNIPIGDGTLAENWHTAEEHSGWDADAQEFGTPQNSKPAVEPTPYEIPAVIFSELMWMGDFAAESHEWIELQNTTDQDIVLSGWQITRLGDKEETVMLTIPSGVIPAHSYFLIANNKAEETNFAVEPDLLTADVALPNSQLQLKLYDGPFDGAGKLIDIADDGMGAPAAGDADAKKAMVRNIPIGDGTLAESWHTAEEHSGWDADAQEFGTPQGSKLLVEPTPYEIPAVIFSELMWMGDFAAASHEWIELQNMTDKDIDLSGWQITRLIDKEETVMLTIPYGIIPARGYFLIANNKAEEANFAVEPDLVTADVSLPNNQLQLKLYDGPFDSGGNLIDTADDGTGAPAAGDAETKASMIRNDPIRDGVLADSWHTADTREGWNDGAQEFGTPNSSGITRQMPAWDVNQDGQVDISDLVLAGKYFGESSPANPRADVNQDKVVDIIDLSMIVAHFSEVISSGDNP